MIIPAFFNDPNFYNSVGLCQGLRINHRDTNNRKERTDSMSKTDQTKDKIAINLLEHILLLTGYSTLGLNGSSVCVMQWTGVIRDGTLI